MIFFLVLSKKCENKMLPVLTKYKMNSNIKNDYDQCFIGNHLKEECHKKSFSQKTGKILLQDVPEKDRALLERRCQVKYLNQI